MRDRSFAPLPGLLAPCLLGAIALTSGCGNHPDRTQCEAFADHYIELAVGQYEDPEDVRVARETAEGARGQFINHCVDAGSTQTLDCALAATTLETYRECFPKPPAKAEDGKADGKTAADKTTPRKTAPKTAPKKLSKTSSAPKPEAKTGAAASSEKPEPATPK